ncbi:MAG: apolipoprotein N-acyltransferase [Cyanobacteriota bacterium]|nr:apolipoprotein N-acyltransferase [Cyanobacteriota bacterium]
MKSNIFAKPLIALASGITMGLTVAPVGAWFVAWFAMIPLWLIVINSSKQTKKSFSPSPPLPLPPSLLWALGYHGTALYWITGLHPLTWLGVPWLGSIAIASFAWFFISFWGGILTMLWAKLMKIFSTQNSLLRVLIGTAIWCALERVWSAGPLWWSSLSYTQSPHNLVILHLGQISGPTAVTAVIVAVNGLFAEALNAAFIARMQHNDLTLFPSPYQGEGGILQASQRLGIIAIAIFISAHLIGFSLYSRPLSQPSETALKVGIVQGNIPNRLKFKPEGKQRIKKNYTQGYLNLVNQGAEAVVTPEGALPIFEDEIIQSPLIAAVREKGVLAWVGGYKRQGKGRYTNSLLTFTGEGQVYSRYDKEKLVPLGEYVPFENILGGIISRLSPVTARQIPGKPNQIVKSPFGNVTVGICYGSAFAEQFRNQTEKGGQFIITASNNDPYSAAMQFQHHAQDIMRAIENDRWAVRATNTGYSAFVNPHGQTLWISGHDTYETRAQTIYRQQTQTLYVRWGDWLCWVLLGFAIGIWGWEKGRKGQGDKETRR